MPLMEELVLDGGFRVRRNYERVALLRVMRRNEAIVRSMLCRWVSELEPAIAFDRHNNIIGLTPAGGAVGSSPFILYREVEDEKAADGV